MKTFMLDKNHIVSFVRLGFKIYYVSTNDTFDVGWETMVFKTKMKLTPIDTDFNPDLIDFNEIYTIRHIDRTDAMLWHEVISNNIKKVL